MLTLGTALIGLVGVLVGGWLTSRLQGDRANKQALREAAGAYLSAVEVYLDRARVLERLLESSEEAAIARRAQQHQVCGEAWTQLLGQLPGARLSGPETEAAAADELHHEVMVYADAVDAWYQSASDQPSARAFYCLLVQWLVCEVNGLCGVDIGISWISGEDGVSSEFAPPPVAR